MKPPVLVVAIGLGRPNRLERLGRAARQPAEIAVRGIARIVSAKPWTTGR